MTEWIKVVQDIFKMADWIKIAQDITQWLIIFMWIGTVYECNG